MLCSNATATTKALGPRRSTPLSRRTPGSSTEVARPPCSSPAAGRETDGGSEAPPPRTCGSAEECGDSGGVPARRLTSLYDAVAKRALRTTHGCCNVKVPGVKGQGLRTCS